MSKKIDHWERIYRNRGWTSGNHAPNPKWSEKQACSHYLFLNMRDMGNRTRVDIYHWLIDEGFSGNAVNDVFTDLNWEAV